MAAPKKDFDKEYIFNLIMPTGPVPEEEVSLPPLPDDPDQSLEEPARDSLSLLRERMERPAPITTVQLRPTKDLLVVNLMEQLVTDRLDAAFEKFNCCRCDKCRRDAAAIALNSLPPRYVVVEPENLSQMLEESSTREVSAALIKAILQVKNHPKH